MALAWLIGGWTGPRLSNTVLRGLIGVTGLWTLALIYGWTGSGVVDAFDPALGESFCDGTGQRGTNISLRRVTSTRCSLQSPNKYPSTKCAPCYHQLKRNRMKATVLPVCVDCAIHRVPSSSPPARATSPCHH